MQLYKTELNITALLLLVLITTFARELYSQSISRDLNAYYRFPFSVGVEYQPFFLFNEYMAYDVSAIIRVPLRSIPILQPSVQAGIMQFSSIKNTVISRDLSHFDFYALAGLNLSLRMTPAFEMGGELSAGLSQSYYKNLEGMDSKEAQYYGDLNWLARAGLHLAFNPVYNLSLDIHPQLKYITTTGRLDIFDSFIFSLGVSAAYRGGKDPDRYINIFIAELESLILFAGLQPYYTENPFTTLTIKNTTHTVLENIEIAFFQKGYMDSPTPAGGIHKLEKNAQTSVALYASFNDNIFNIEGMSPLVGEIRITYKADGRRVEQKKNVTYSLYDKTSILWDDDGKAAAYITPADSILKSYARFIQQACKKSINEGYNWPLQFAVQVYYGFKEIGLIYQTDSVQNFAAAKQNQYLIDSIFLPRQSLQRLSGDCDDLTVLYCSLLESIGIETGYITLPDHILPVFNTNQPVGSYTEIYPDSSMFIDINGEAWIPLEVTLLDKGNFREAWSKGLANYTKGRVNKNLQINLTRKCQQVFKPITLKEKDISINYGNAENINLNFKTDLAAAVNTVLEFYKKMLETKEDYNKVALLCMKFGEYTEAESLLKQSLILDDTYGLAVINLGNLAFIRKEYTLSLDYYKKAEQTFKLNTNRSSHYVYLLLNISVVYSYLNDNEQAREYFSKADAIDPRITGRNVYQDYEASLKKGQIIKSSDKGNIIEEIWLAE